MKVGISRGPEQKTLLALYAHENAAFFVRLQVLTGQNGRTGGKRCNEERQYHENQYTTKSLRKG